MPSTASDMHGMVISTHDAHVHAMAWPMDAVAGFEGNFVNSTESTRLSIRRMGRRHVPRSPGVLSETKYSIKFWKWHEAPSVALELSLKGISICIIFRRPDGLPGDRRMGSFGFVVALQMGKWVRADKVGTTFSVLEDVFVI